MRDLQYFNKNVIIKGLYQKGIVTNVLWIPNNKDFKKVNYGA